MGVAAAAAVELELFEMSSMIRLCMLPVELPGPPPGTPTPSWLAFRMFRGLWARTGDGGMRSMEGMPSSRLRWPPLKMFGGRSSEGEGELGGWASERIKNNINIYFISCDFGLTELPVVSIFQNQIWCIFLSLGNTVLRDGGNEPTSMSPHWRKLMPGSRVVLGESWGVAAVVVMMGGSRTSRILERRGASLRRSLIEYVCIWGERGGGERGQGSHSWILSR